VARIVTPVPISEEVNTIERPHPVDLEPGDSVGEYVILQKLGEGGFGAVYEAAHPVIGKRAAVKVLHAQHSSDEAVTSRFVAEARAVNQIRNKNIVDIFAFGDLADGRHYYVMELLEGVPLDDYLQRAGRLPIEEVLSILHPIAKALGAAHEAGIAHRDLKPENVFLEIDDDGNVQPKILDFGLAKLLAPGTVTVHKTRSGAPMGTPRYMSPEQCRGVPVDHRTDIYAFGCMTYRMLTGVPPFDAATALDVMMAHVSKPPPPPSQYPDVDSAFDEPVLKMLEKQPDDRPRTLLIAYESLASAALLALGSKLDDKSPASTLLRDTVLERERTLPRVLDLPKPRTVPSTPPRPLRESRRSLVLPLLLAALGLSAGWFIVGRAARPAASPQVASSGTAPPRLAPQVAPPAASVRASAPLDEGSVAIRVNAQPPHAEIYQADRLLGVAPGPVRLACGEQEIQLVIKATGFVSATVPLKPSADQAIKVTLVPRATRPAKGGVSHDLENPY
jgi:serine/threonine-protein kinase